MPTDTTLQSPARVAFDYARIPSTTKRIERIFLDGQFAWVKRPERKSFPLAPIVQKAFGLLGMPRVLRCTYIMDRHEALYFEMARIKALGAAKQPVPHVLAQGPDYAVTSDVGASLWDHVRTYTKAGQGASALALLEKGAVALAELHIAGHHHGQPYPKNMTWDGKAVHFIDLEDDVLSVMSPAEARLRDVWMMVHGCWPFAKAAPQLAQRLVEVYSERAGMAITTELKAGLPQLAGYRSAALHAAISPNVMDNRKRYLWTLLGVVKGLKPA